MVIVKSKVVGFFGLELFVGVCVLVCIVVEKMIVISDNMVIDLLIERLGICVIEEVLVSVGYYDLVSMIFFFMMYELLFVGWGKLDLCD